MRARTTEQPLRSHSFYLLWFILCYRPRQLIENKTNKDSLELSLKYDSPSTSSYLTVKLHPSPVQSLHIVHLFLIRTLGPQFGCRIYLCFTDQETQEENVQGGTGSLVGQFLHPSLVQRSRSIQHMKTVQLFQNRILILCPQFGCRISLCFTDQETQKENLQGETSSLVGQFLHPISPVQSSRSIQPMKPVQVVLNRILTMCRQFGCRTSLCITDPETQDQRDSPGGIFVSLKGQFLHT